MLAVVSMALVSCGGDGGGGGLKPAEPAITYESANYDFETDVRDSFQVKNVAIRENGTYKVSVTAQIEMVKDLSEPIQHIATGVELLDKNGAKLCSGGFGFEGATKVGEVSSASCTIETEVGMPASKVIEEAKFYRITRAIGVKPVHF